MKNNYKSKPRQNNNRKYKGTNVKESKEFSKLKESANDVNWYVYNDQVTRDIGSYSFNNALGVALDIGGKPFEVPGIMSILCAPCPGVSNSPSSAVNLAAKNLYSFVRYKNSGHTNYDSPDLMMYILGLDSLYGYYAWMTRIYGAARSYVQQNRYLGNRILQANGVNTVDMSEHLADLRAYINEFAVKLSAFSVPSTMTMFKRHMWMFANIFKDEDDVKASMYMYTPLYFYRYNEAGARLEPEFWLGGFNANSGIGGPVANTKTFNNIRVYGDTLMGNIVASEAFNIMSGDILKAYGEENLWKLSMIPDDYLILPMYSEEVLLQIHNTNFVGTKPINAVTDTTYSMSSLWITQSTGIGYGEVLFTPKFRNTAYMAYERLFDSWKQSVPPEDVIVGSRNMLAGTWYGEISGNTAYHMTTLTACGCDICFFAQLWKLDSLGNFTADIDYTEDTIGSLVAVRSIRLSRFNEAPLYYSIVNSYPTDSLTLSVSPNNIFGEISNYTTMSGNDIRKLHDSCLLGLLAVPMLGNVAK